METGLYVVPVNWHLAAAEVAYILGDSEAGAFVAHERFAGVAAAAADQAGIDPGARFAVGAIPGSPRWPSWAKTAPAAPARGPRAPRCCTRRARRAGPRACAAR